MHDDVSKSRRAFAQAMVASPIALAAPPASSLAQSADGSRVLRYAFRVAESGFDPAQVQDLYSSTLNANIFEAPFEFAYLERPFVLRPNTAAAMPMVNDDFRRIVVKLRPGIYFAKDPAFNGRPRELVAADYVYSIKRHYDPRW